MTVGLTIIEVLVSIALLSVIVLVVLTPLTGFFGLTRQSNQQVSATQSAQRAMESLRGDWLNREKDYYGKNCLTNPTVLDGLTIEITALDADNQSLGLRDKPGNCVDAVAEATPPPLKRVKITQADAQGKVLADLTVLVDRR